MPSARFSSASQVEKRNMVQQEVRAMAEQERMVKAVSMKKQGRWVNWEGVRQKKLTWNDIWSMEQDRLQFQLKSVYDVLSSPTNLATWGITEDPNCSLCGRPANLDHILTSCQVALKDGRYTWRHNQVLAVLAEALEKYSKRPRKRCQKVKFVNFVKAGEQSSSVKVEGGGLLGAAEDWKV